MPLTESARSGPVETTEDAPGDPLADELLELLDAEYTRPILEAIRADPKPARAIADACGASRPTVYRRLNALQEAGLVDTDLAYDADGHHRTVFEAAFESLTVAVTEDGLSVTVTTSGSERSSNGRTRPAPTE
ncbi:winged helix-turn-helix transcriptional regulator [Halosimplex rubrum]|uniref:Winged helix-turn-helix transcriptional regulator n=1 Tax=Halosimplex rubrum TaxID=869889 RepID=A0A7D5T3X4_9EURY|nr:winged helix-turn-helix domain-containing protein [Halosimplex rubrum]QLH77250.1 winged helix-turn-helix transcriptional regulator [Halosimplex rubrum]